MLIQNLLWYLVMPLFFLCALIQIKKNTDHLRTYEFLYDQNKKIILLKQCELTANQSYFEPKNEVKRNSLLQSRLRAELENVT